MTFRKSLAIAAALMLAPLTAVAQEQPLPEPEPQPEAGEPTETTAPTEMKEGQHKPEKQKQKQAKAAALNVAEKEPLGQFLVDSKGRTLYMFTADEGQQGSTCYGPCAQAWPPLTTEGDPRAAAPGLDPEKLDTIERRDGTRQVTYNGMPLYYFVKDKRAGMVKGQDITGHGGEWYVVSPEGEKIETSMGEGRPQQ